jgi:hypothetical protein
MRSYGFPAPWLNGHPIDAPKKIDMIDWYSQTDGYYPDATENDSRNSVLTLFRSQGTILYEDEFRSETTINQDNSQTIGRVNRVFRAIDMINKYKAAYEDGADLSQSAIVDFKTVWRDHEENVLPHKLMHNLQQVEEELRNRSPENSPVRAFWMEQETQRFKWVFAGPTTDDLHQDHPSAIDNHIDPIVPGYYYDQDLAVAVYVPNSQEYADSFRAVFADYFQNPPQNFSGWFGQALQQPLTTLNPTTANFAPGPNNSASAVQAQKASTSPENGPINFTGEPVTLENELTIAELVAKGQKEYNWGERDDESWPGDDIFIPTFRRLKQPWSKQRLLGLGNVAPEPDPITQTKPTHKPTSTQELQNSSQKPQNDINDSGYASGNTPPPENGYAAATKGNSGNDTDDETSETEEQERQQSERGDGIDVETFLEYPAPYRMLRYQEYYQECEDSETRKRSRVFTWLAGIDEP